MTTSDGSLPLTTDRALQLAVDATGLDDFGDDQRFRIGLEIFLDSFEGMSPSPERRLAAEAYTAKWLTDRLHWVADERAHPEILDIQVERPVIIVGMPRTGTTVLYDYLAGDPAARAPLYWEAADVWPAPEVETFTTDPRIAAAQAGLDYMLSVSPEIASLLPVGAQLPAECNRFMPYHFYGSEIGTFMGVPEHTEWVSTGVAPGLYDTHRRVLQQLSWKGPRGRWTLKSPVHLFNLEPLIERYPDACLIWTHRDMLSVLTSLTDLYAAARRVAGLPSDKAAIAAELLELWASALERGMAARENPRVAERILDIPFRDTAANPLAVVERVHDRFHIPFTGAHADAISTFIADHPKGEHKLKPSETNLTAEMIRDRFASYYERFAEFI